MKTSLYAREKYKKQIHFVKGRESDFVLKLVISK